MRVPDDFAAVAAGLDAPFGRGRRKAVPVLYGLACSGREGRTPASFLAEIETTSLLVRVSALIGSGFFSSADFQGTLESRDAASYFTGEDGFDSDRSFLQSSAGAACSIGYAFGSFGLAKIQAGAERITCSKLDGASPFRAPPDHTQASLGLRLEWRDVSFLESWTIKEGFCAVLDAAYLRKDLTAPWGFEERTLADSGRSAEWGRARCWIGAYMSDGRDKNLLLDLRIGFFPDADRASAARAGGMVGDPPLAGTPYGRIAVDRFAFLRAEFSFGLWKGARLSVGADMGIFRDLDRRNRRAAGFFVCLTQKTLMGIPVAVTYGCCPMGDDGAESIAGHEIMIVAKAALF